MSYTTYHNIRQLPNGDFLVKTKVSNDGCPPETWTMDYYRRTFPFLSKEGLQAVFLLQGRYYGNRYYPAKWKRLEKLTDAYCDQRFEETGDRAATEVFDFVSKEQYEREIQEIGQYPHKGLHSQELQNMVSQNMTYEAAHDQWQADVTKIANDLAAYLREHAKAEKVGRYIITFLTREGTPLYVASHLTMRSTRLHPTQNAANAFVFKRTKSEIDALVARLPSSAKAVLVE